MANEFQHKDPGTSLTQAEYITTDGTGHIFSCQATGDILYASSSTVLKNLAKAADNTILTLSSCIPAWTATPTLTTLTTTGNIELGHACQNTLSGSGGVLSIQGNRIFHAGGTDIPVADGGTGASCFTANGILVGNGTSAIQATATMATKGHLMIGDGSGVPTMLAVGSNCEVLTACSGEATGVKWASAGGGINSCADNVINNGYGLIVGHGSQLAPGGVTSEAQFLGTADADSSLTIGRFSANACPAHLYFVKGRHACVGGTTTLSACDSIGDIQWHGADGGDIVPIAARIRAGTDGTTGANDMPGFLSFQTTADGAQAPTERMKINSSGNVTSAGKFRIGDGTSSSPSWSFNCDTNTGLYRP